MPARPRIVGVLGGMGPAATIDFMAKVLHYSQAGAASEQDNVRLIVDSNPWLPDRNAAIAGIGPSPAPELSAMARGLAAAGAQILVMPCNAAHAFASAVRTATPLPLLHLIDETVAAVVRDHPAARRIGILAVSGAVQAQLYERALEQHGLVPIVPTSHERTSFMEGIWRIKAGDLVFGAAAMRETAARLIGRGAEVIVAGCTEVPLVLGTGDLAVPMVDSTDVLAKQAVIAARNKITHIA